MQLGTYADGRILSYDQNTGAFTIGDALVSAEQVRAYWAAGQIVWIDPQTAAWFDGAFPSTSMPAPAQVPAKTKNHAVIWIVLAVVLVVLLGCGGIMAAIAIPIFSAAKGSAQAKVCWAQERTVEGAAQMYQAEKGELPDSMDAMVSEGLLKQVPTCPTGGTYTYDDSTGELTCSQHGSYKDESSSSGN
jgi:competence protein ComGC